IAAAPITYAIDGIQYVAVMAGWGGAWPMLGGQLAEQPVNGVGPNRLLVFRLDGKGILPPLPNAAPRQLDPPTETASADLIARGNGLYGENCLRCHGMAAVSASMVPDLRHSGAIHSADAFNQIVIGGALKDQGMPGFRTQITASDLEAIRAYLIHRANQDAKNNWSGTR
ncbi:MAG: c-type cytochrome, partial [Alphaproteobacteria bacterium]|nr:c-type cytochrome [Alphaproteobacteria bacterium]